MKKLIFIATLVMLVLVGCSGKPDAVTKSSLTATEIQQLMWDTDLSASAEFVLDREYGLPTESWITDVLYPELFQELKRDGLWKYAAESNDCDDFAARARLVANKLNNSTTNNGKRGIAFGEYHYYSNIGGQHALNFAITKDGQSKYRIVFFEPQTGKIVFLNKKEIESVTGWIL